MRQSSNITAELTVLRKAYITPYYIRVFFTSDQIAALSEATVGIHNKIFIPRQRGGEVLFPEHDPVTGRWKAMEEGKKNIVRTYTHRGIDLAKQELWIDFVAHGDEGPASAWAISATEGDRIGVMMSGGEMKLFPKVENYILIGDATAIPVLSVILSELDATARGKCIIEVHGPQDEQHLETCANIDIMWVHNEHPHEGSQLAAVSKSLPLPTASRFAYVAAEFTVVKEIRHYLRKDNLWLRDEVDAYSYWKRGVSEDKSANERHSENANDNIN